MDPADPPTVLPFHHARLDHVPVRKPTNDTTPRPNERGDALRNLACFAGLIVL
jgi:hypothetical protein